MKKIHFAVFVLTMMVLMIACSKMMEPLPSPERLLSGMQAPVTTKGDQPPLLPRPFQPASRCIYSYDELVKALGTNSITIHSVLLEGGVTVKVGGAVSAIRYTARHYNEPQSLFRSHLDIEHTYLGFPTSFSQENWTLGCAFSTAGQSTLTNLVFQGNIYSINTSFTWRLPPSPNMGRQILYLIAN